MRIQWMKRRTVVALTAGTVALAVFSHSGSGLIAGLFSKDKCELPKRKPCGDCSFGYARTVWRPWGTCCETTSPQFSREPVFVPGGSYTPLYETPYSTVRGAPHDGSRVIIVSPPHSVDLPSDNASSLPAYSNESPPAGTHELPPILSGPGTDDRTVPIGAADSESQIPPLQGLAPPRQGYVPLSPNVRSIESPVLSDQPQVPSNNQTPASREELPTLQQSSPNQDHGSHEDPIRGLLPGSSDLPTQNNTLPVTAAPQNSIPEFNGSLLQSNTISQFETPLFTPSPRQSEPPTDYSEYIPLPTGDSIPESQSLPDLGKRDGSQRARPSVQATLPETSPPASETVDPGVGQFSTHPSHDPYADYRTLPSATEFRPQFNRTRPGFEELPSAATAYSNERVTRTSAERVAEPVQHAARRLPAQNERPRSASAVRSSEHQPAAVPKYEVPDWKPLSDPSKTYRSVAPQRGGEWRTLQTPTGNRAARATSQQRSNASQITAPPWKSQTTTPSASGYRAVRPSPAVQPATVAPSRGSASLGRLHALPSVEAVLRGEQFSGSRPARVVQETLYDVIDVDRESRGRSAGHSVASVEQRPVNQSVRGTLSDSAADWQSIRAADGNAQATAQSSQLAPR